MIMVVYDCLIFYRITPTHSEIVKYRAVNKVVFRVVQVLFVALIRQFSGNLKEIMLPLTPQLLTMIHQKRPL